jgi:oligopeptide transport system ATP-binding protein
MSASPHLDVSDSTPRKRIVLEGEMPSPLDPPSGCRFRTRCWKAQDICATDAPPAVASTDDPLHVAECHFPLMPENAVQLLAPAAARSNESDPRLHTITDLGAPC